MAKSKDQIIADIGNKLYDLKLNLLDEIDLYHQYFKLTPEVLTWVLPVALLNDASKTAIRQGKLRDQLAFAFAPYRSHPCFDEVFALCMNQNGSEWWKHADVETAFRNQDSKLLARLERKNKKSRHL